MLAAIPTWILILPLLIICGAILGALINWAIYAWAMFQDRRISPWQSPHKEPIVDDGKEFQESSRIPFDRVPILGWWGRRRDSDIYGAGFWIRPMLIEIAAMIGLPWFYYWQMGGGLTGSMVPPAYMGGTWFFAHGILLALMCIATFIDFDEKTIPDLITIPGTIIALLFAAFAPWFRLPEVVPGGWVGPLLKPINYCSPDKLGGLHDGSQGFWIAIAIFAIWIWALLPKLSPFYVGLKKSARFMVAHALQPKRKTKCEIRTKRRSMPMLTKILGGLFAAGMVLIPWAWISLPAANWECLFGSFIGIAIGGGLIWAIRIVGTCALQQEAMGFGDVTLWAMVGAFLGWQSTLSGFFIAPFLALGVVLVGKIVNKDNELAFGPWLCIGAALTLFFWPPIWEKMSRTLGLLGKDIWYIAGGILIMMVIMLMGMAWFKGGYGDEEQEDSDEAAD